MSSTKKVVIIFSAIALVCIIGTGIVLGIFFGSGNDLSSFFNIFEGSKIEVNESETLVLDDVSELVVDCTAGDITVIEADDARVELTGMIVGRQDNEKYLEVSKQDGTLTVRFDVETGFGNLFFADMQMKVYLPKEQMLDLQLISTSGNIQMKDLAFGDVSVSQTSGDVDIGNCCGTIMDMEITSGNTQITGAAFDEIQVISTSGNVDIEDTSANLTVGVTSGNINITNVSGELDAETTSGNITVDAAQADFGEMDIGATSGNVKLYLDEDAAFDLRANTISGKVQTEFDILVSGSDGLTDTNVSGACNGGGPLIDIEATSGNISVIQK